MSKAVLTLIIVAVTFTLYIVDRLPVAVVTMAGMLAMVFAGVMDYKTAFGNFGSTPVMLTLGMIIIIDAIIESGLAAWFEKWLMHMTRWGEKVFLIIVFISAGLISIFTNNSALVALYMPFIASTARATDGRISKKNLYLPLAMGGLIGGTGSLAGSTAPLLASQAMVFCGKEPFSFFTTAPVALTILAVVAVCYALFLYDLQVKWLDFDETPQEVGEIRTHSVDRRKAWISGLTFLACVFCFIFRPFGWDLGLISVTGATLLIALKCADAKREFVNMPWNALIVLGAALSMANGFVASGAGELVIEKLMAAFGDHLGNGSIMVLMFLTTGWLLSQFMSNGSLVSMLAAIAVPLALHYGIDPIPVAIACAIGASLAMATPVATTTITMVQVAGYRFKDYFRIGGTVGLIGVVSAWVSICLFYHLF